MACHRYFERKGLITNLRIIFLLLITVIFLTVNDSEHSRKPFSGDVSAGLDRRLRNVVPYMGKVRISLNISSARGITEQDMVHITRYRVENICTTAERIFLLIPIHSGVKNKKKRSAIRKSWASVTSYKGRRIRHVFVVGETRSPEERSFLTYERQHYGDIIVGNYLDSYRNLTRKMVHWLQWIDSCNASIDYVMKCDDDVIVNPWAIIDFLEAKLNPHDPILMGQFAKYRTPERFKNGRWFISYRQWRQKRVPQFLQGYAELMSIEAVRRFNQAIKERVIEKRFNTTWTDFPVDDVYLGILAKVTEVNVVYSASFTNTNVYPTSSTIKDCVICSKVAILTSKFNTLDMDNTWRVLSKIMKNNISTI